MLEKCCGFIHEGSNQRRRLPQSIIALFVGGGAEVSRCGRSNKKGGGDGGEQKEKKGSQKASVARCMCNVVCVQCYVCALYIR